MVISGLPSYAARSGKWMLCSDSLQRLAPVGPQDRSSMNLLQTFRHLAPCQALLAAMNVARLSRHMDLFVSSRERGLPKYLAPSRFFAMSTLEPAHSRRGQCSA